MTGCHGSSLILLYLLQTPFPCGCYWRSLSWNVYIGRETGILPTCNLFVSFFPPSSKKDLFYVYMCLPDCLLCAPYVLKLPQNLEEGVRFLGTGWSYGWLWATKWVPGTEPESSVRAGSGLTVEPPPLFLSCVFSPTGTIRCPLILCSFILCKNQILRILV